MTNETPRTALVTGAAGAIGRAIVEKLLDAGHRVVLVDLNNDALERAKVGLPSDRVLCLHSDISGDGAAAALDASIRAQWEPVSILINNAGVSPKHAGKSLGLIELTKEEWDFVMSVNVFAPMRLAQQFVPFMREQRWGRIVNLSSRAGRSVANSAGPAYMTSKAAILGLTRSIASEFAGDGITSNSVAPGIIETPLSRLNNPEVFGKLVGGSPMRRGGAPVEVAATVAFLASNDAGYITGACVDINGGTFMC